MNRKPSVKQAAISPGEFFRNYGVVVALVILLSVVAVAEPKFLAFGNLMNILSQWAPVGIMGIGATYVIITRGFDLSVAAIFALCSVSAAGLGITQSPLVAFTVAILIGIVVGWGNGFIVTVLKVNPFIATLGSSLIIGGITLLVTGNRPFVVSNPEFAILGNGRILGIPYSGLILIALMILAGLILAYSSYGHAVYATGGNPEASYLVGIRTSLVTASTYAISGGLAGVAGVLTASLLSSAQPSTNPDLVFDVLTVVIVGGTSLAGGKGAIWRTAVGVALLATLQNGFNLLNLNPYYQDIIKGLIIIAAISTVSWKQFFGRLSKK